MKIIQDRLVRKYLRNLLKKKPLINFSLGRLFWATLQRACVCVEKIETVLKPHSKACFNKAELESKYKAKVARHIDLSLVSALYFRRVKTLQGFVLGLETCSYNPPTMFLVARLYNILVKQLTVSIISTSAFQYLFSVQKCSTYYKWLNIRKQDRLHALLILRRYKVVLLTLYFSDIKLKVWYAPVRISNVKHPLFYAFSSRTVFALKFKSLKAPPQYEQ